MKLCGTKGIDMDKPKTPEEIAEDDFEICKNCGVIEVESGGGFCSIECKEEWRFENGQH